MLLKDYEIYVQGINYPTVSKGTERLRITPTPGHDDYMMEHLVDSLIDVWRRLDLKKVDQWQEQSDSPFAGLSPDMEKPVFYPIQQ